VTNPNTRLETIHEIRPGEDAHIRANKAPVLTGSVEHHLTCGGCGIVIARNSRPDDLHERFQTEQRLILECICGALNIVPRGDAQPN
jgi:hypothetical protein